MGTDMLAGRSVDLEPREHAAGVVAEPVSEISTAESGPPGATKAPRGAVVPGAVRWPQDVVSARIDLQTKAQSTKSFGRRLWRDLCIGGGIVMLIHVFLVQISVVRGLSMAPSLHDGDRLMVDRVSYSVTDVTRFDVVVLRYPRNPEVDFVKRVIGLPGDRVELHDGSLHVNGEPVTENFGHVIDQYALGSWLVPDGHYFVLGDNRPISCDSREFGMVSHDLLKGKVRMCFWPLDRLAVF